MPEAIRALTMPKWGIEMTEGTITGWTAQEGQRVAKGEALLDVETEKIVNSVEAPAAGLLRRILAQAGDVRPVGSLIAVFAENEISDSQIDAFVDTFQGAVVSFDPDAAPAQEAAPTSSAPVESVGDSEQRVSPVARRLAESLGVDLSKVRGTGRNGRISKEDIEAYAATTSAPSGSAKPAAAGETRSKMSATRAVIARRLLESSQSIPHYRLAIEIDAGALLAHKQQVSAQSGTKVTVNDLIVRACGLALMQHPALNSTLDGEEIVRHAHANIAIAIATAEGLITPIVRQAETKSIAEVARDTSQLAERAKSSSLTREDISGASFTVSNLGMFGLERFDAIINPPQVAILAVGGAIDKVLAKQGVPTVGKAMVLTLSADHRVIDGAVAAAFLSTLRELLEQPNRL